jgi:hypothetical protein
LQADAEKPEQSRQKKNCLAMKTLNLEQMEKVSGGSMAKVLGCTMGSILLVAAFAGLFALTAGAGVVAVASAVAGASLSPASWGLACFTDY